jgi:hypothetical protein
MKPICSAAMALGLAAMTPVGTFAQAGISPQALSDSTYDTKPGTHGAVNWLLPIEPDPMIQHAKEVYINNGCAWCHGVDLVVPQGDAVDLRKSKIVALDVDGKLIGQILRGVCRRLQGFPRCPRTVT